MRTPLIIFLLLPAFFCAAQQQKKITKEDTAILHMREVVVYMDTTIEYNNYVKGTNIIDNVLVNKGLQFCIQDNIFRVFYFVEYDSSAMNGIYMDFYMPSNMPKVKGNYLHNEKDGEWFYWNEKGILTRKEIWKMGKLIKTINRKQ